MFFFESAYLIYYIKREYKTRTHTTEQSRKTWNRTICRKDPRKRKITTRPSGNSASDPAAAPLRRRRSERLSRRRRSSIAIEGFVDLKSGSPEAKTLSLGHIGRSTAPSMASTSRSSTTHRSRRGMEPDPPATDHLPCTDLAVDQTVADLGRLASEHLLHTDRKSVV